MSQSTSTMTNDVPEPISSAPHSSQEMSATQTQFIPHGGDRFAVGFLVVTFMLLAAIMLADIIRALWRW